MVEAHEDQIFPYNSEANAVFPSKEYLKRFEEPTADPMKIHIKFLAAWHNFYKKYTCETGKAAHLLEYGGGPTLHSLITASKYVETITFADYAESNRNEINMWMKENKECELHVLLLLELTRHISPPPPPPQ